MTGWGNGELGDLGPPRDVDEALVRMGGADVPILGQPATVYPPRRARVFLPLQSLVEMLSLPETFRVATVIVDHHTDIVTVVVEGPDPRIPAVAVGNLLPIISAHGIVNPNDPEETPV